MDDVWKGLTVLLGTFAAWVALQQWWINREKLRLDLFARRHAVFDSTRKFIASIVREGRVDQAAQNDFWAGTADAAFLFNADVPKYVDQIHKQAIKLHYHRQMQGPQVPDRGAHIEAESTVLLWFAEQLRDDGLPKAFGRYLRFQDLQGPLAWTVQYLRDRWAARKARDAGVQTREHNK